MGGDIIKKHEKEILQSYLDDEKAVLAELEKQYKKALDEINDKIRLLQSKTTYDPSGMGRNEQVPLNLLPQSRIYQIEHQKALRDQVSAILDMLHASEFETISEFMEKGYQEGFLASMYSMQQQGIPLVLPIDQEQAVQAVQTDSKISEGLYKALGNDIGTLKKTISSEITRGIASAMTFEDIARNISNTSNTGMKNAMRIARTEVSRIRNQAAFDAALKAKKNGADILKQWSAILDNKTRKRHRELDGQIRELEKKFSNGLLYPCHKKGKAADVINCRCVALVRARWGLDEEELETLKKRAEYWGLDKTKDFKDFKKKYLKATKKKGQK